MAPEFSVVIPAYNAAAYLAEAIGSVLSQDGQPALEVIVVNDGSTDETAAVATAFSGQGVQLVHRVNGGIAAARNTGIRQARGRFIAFLDADDLWSADKLAAQRRLLEQRDGPDCVFGQVRLFISPELTQAERTRYACPETPQPGYLASALLMERERFLSVGLFDEHLGAGEFIAWYLKAQAAGIRFGLCEEIVLHRRIHTRNTTQQNVARRNEDYMRVVRAHLQRQRS